MQLRHKMAAIVAGAMVAGCGPDTRFLSWPEVPGAVAQILSVSDDDGTVIDLRASSIGEVERVSNATSGQARRLEIITYDRSLEELGLSSGSVVIEQGCDRGCGLIRDALASHSARLDADGALSAWSPRSPSAETSEALVSDFAARCDRCLPYQTRAIQLSDVLVDGKAAFMTVGEGGIFVGLETGEVFQLDPELEPRAVCLGGYSHKLRAGWIRGDELWAMDTVGVHRISIPAQTASAPCEVNTSTAPGQPDPELRALTGAPEAAPFELYVLTNTGTLLRFDGESWARWAQFEVEPDAELSLEWNAPGRVSVTFEQNRFAIVTDAEVEVHEAPDPDVIVVGQDFDSELGHVFVSRDHGVALFEAGRWRLESEVPVGWFRGRAVIPINEGLLYTIGGGRFGRWYSADGYCPLEDGLSSANVTSLERMGDRILFDRASDSTGFGATIGMVEKVSSRCRVD